MNFLFSVVLYLFFNLNTYSQGNVFYVNEKSDCDKKIGSMEFPFCSVNQALSLVNGGDKLVLLPGVYRKAINIINRKYKTSPLDIYAVTPGTVTFKINKSNEYVINIKNSENIRLTNIKVEWQVGNKGWIYIGRSKHIYINNSTFTKARSSMPFKIVNSEQLVFDGLGIMGEKIFNMVTFSHSKKIIIRGCYLTESGHSLLQFYPENTNSDILIEGNVFYPKWGRAIEFFNTKNVVMQNNIIWGSFDGGRTADGLSKYLLNNSVIRFNRFLKNKTIPMAIFPYKDNLFIKHKVNNLFIYNNSFVNNYPSGIKLGGKEKRISNIFIFNNEFIDNDYFANFSNIRGWANSYSGVLLYNNRFNPEKFTVSNNIWLGGVFQPKRIVSSAEFNKGSKLYGGTHNASGIIAEGLKKPRVGFYPEEKHHILDCRLNDASPKLKQVVYPKEFDIEYMTLNGNIFYDGSVINTGNEVDFIISKYTRDNDYFYCINYIENFSKEKFSHNINLKFTFERSDQLWWKHLRYIKHKWYKWKIVSDTDKNNSYLEVATVGYVSNSSKASMLTEFSLKSWDASKYPVLEFDYKIKIGSQLKVCIKGHETDKNMMKSCVLKSKNIHETNETFSSIENLIADGKWHRKIFDFSSPDKIKIKIDQIKSLIFEVPYDKVKIGDNYSIDNLIIRSSVS